MPGEKRKQEEERKEITSQKGKETAQDYDEGLDANPR